MSDRVLGSDAARAVGRFAAQRGYRAATAPDAPVRATRAEAAEDERAWLDRPTTPTPSVASPEPTTQATSEPRTPPSLFPADAMETAARAKAWRDFLAQVQFSLMVWQLDTDVRTDCEDVRAWIRRCGQDLAAVIA